MNESGRLQKSRKSYQRKLKNLVKFQWIKFKLINSFNVKFKILSMDTNRRTKRILNLRIVRK